MTDNGQGPAWPLCPALFLDLDGTLLDFAATPDGVERSPRFRDLIARLARLEHGAVAFVSGRSIAKLDELLAPHVFALAGLHGQERRRADGTLALAQVERAALDPVREAWRAFAAENPGVVVEDKGANVAIHYRQAPALGEAVTRLGMQLAERLSADWSLLAGNHVLELKPAGVNKGEAIRSFMDEAPFAGRTPVFVGDDVTDEDGFEVVNALDGISIKVAGGPTAARWRLGDVGAVMAWLEDNVAG